MTYKGHVTLNGRTTLQVEVFKNPRKATRANKLNRWYLYRVSNGSRDGFATAADAMAYAVRLNPNIEWTKEGE